MEYKAINSSQYLVHFNPNHDKKNGRFTFKKMFGFDSERTRKEAAKTSAKREVDAVLASRKEAVDKAIAKGDKIVDSANALGKEYEKAFNSAKLDESAKKRILDGLEEDFGKVENPKKSRFQQIKDNCDDEEYFGWVLEEHIDRELFNSLKNNKKLTKMATEFDDLKESYWKDVHAIVDDLAKKYENVDFGFVNDYIYRDKLGTSMPSYITRHFEDYWVNDTDAHYSAVERLTKELEEAKHSTMNCGNYLIHYNKNSIN